MRLYCKFCGEKRLEEDTYRIKTSTLHQIMCKFCKHAVHIQDRPAKTSQIYIE